MNKCDVHLPESVCLVTGGARGIGHNVVMRIALAGAKVWLCDVDKEAGLRAEAALRGAGLAVTFVHANLSTPQAARDLVDSVVAQAGRIDILVNSAKAGERKGLAEENEDNWNTTLRVMLDATFFASQQAIQKMRATGSGSIINIGSIAASRVVPESPSYHAAKAAIVGITRYLAAVAGPWGIRVNCVEPGFIVKDEHRGYFDSADNLDYRALANACHPLRRTGHSDEVAEAILFLASDSARFITGQSIVIDGGLTLQEPFSMTSAILRDRDGKGGGP